MEGMGCDFVRLGKYTVLSPILCVFALKTLSRRLGFACFVGASQHTFTATGHQDLSTAVPRMSHWIGRALHFEQKPPDLKDSPFQAGASSSHSGHI